MNRGAEQVGLHSFFNIGTKWEGVVNTTPQPLNPRGDGWAPGLVWMDAEILAPPKFDPLTIH